jgi:phage baseplate assembly protein W
MNLDYPFHFDLTGRTAQTDDEDHVRDLLEAVLFTDPGERVNRPTFGCGIRRLVFAPNSDELAAATQLLIHGALQEWLGDLIIIDSVHVTAEDAVLRVDVSYTVKRTHERRTAAFSRQAGAGAGGAGVP